MLSFAFANITAYFILIHSSLTIHERSLRIIYSLICPIVASIWAFLTSVPFDYITSIYMNLLWFYTITNWSLIWLSLLQVGIHCKSLSWFVRTLHHLALSRRNIPTMILYHTIIYPIYSCIFFAAVRQSKFKHLTGTTLHKDTHIDNIRNISHTIPGESNMFDANKTFSAVPLGGSGGLIAILKVWRLWKKQSNNLDFIVL